MSEVKIRRGFPELIAAARPKIVDVKAISDRKTDSKKTTRPATFKQDLMDRDKGKCVLSGADKQLRGLHILPRAKGGDVSLFG